MTDDHSALITQFDALKGVDPASVFAVRFVLPVAARTTPEDRSSVVCGDHGGLCSRRFDTQRRRSRCRIGCGLGNLEIPGLADLGGPRHRDREVPRTHVDAHQLSVHLPRRHVLQGADRGARGHALVVATGVSIDGTREVTAPERCWGLRSVIVDRSISGGSSWSGCGRADCPGCMW